MPSKQTINFVVTPDVFDNLVMVFARGTRDGIDFMRYGKGSRSKLVRYAIECGAKLCAAPVVDTLALPEKTGAADAERLKSARGTMTRQECARAAGLKDESSVRNVETRGMALAGKLRTWVEAQEAGGVK